MMVDEYSEDRNSIAHDAQFFTSVSIALSNSYRFTSQEWDRPSWADICYKLLELLKDRPLIFKTI